MRVEPALEINPNHHYIDLSRAWLYAGNRTAALSCLQTARRIAPQHARFHPQVRETLHALARADRRTTGTLREYAAWAGVED